MTKVKPHHTPRWKVIRRQVLLRDNYVCQHCGVQLRRPGSKVGAPPHVDHVIPVSRGGAPFDMGNCVASCQRCNLTKGAKLAVRRRSAGARGGAAFFEAPSGAPPQSAHFPPQGGKARKRKSRVW